MFFDKKLMKTDVGKAWYAAFYKNYTPEINVIEVCNYMETLLDSNHPSEDRRLSLRTSSTILTGITRTFDKQIDELLKDTKIISEELKPDNEEDPPVDAEVAGVVVGDNNNGCSRLNNITDEEDLDNVINSVDD